MRWGLRRIPSVLLSILLILLIQDIRASDEGLEVKTPYGTYRGHVMKSRGGRDLLSFKGVPYAQPPVGPLRFKEPMKLEEREEIVEADQEKECVQLSIGYALGLKWDSTLNKSDYIGSEDCLYLNVFRPKDIPVTRLLPVYFWIHGGGFLFGSCSEATYGPKFLLDKERDMVLVTVNYRLGIFGFLSANDENLPGNLGLKDQAQALKWVNENIKLFGGDPNSITIGGNSAGAASVSHHLHSKSSRGLFHRAISQSGSGNCPWALRSRKEAREVAARIISFLGCPSEPTQMFKCLQGIPVRTLFKSTEILKVDKTATIMYLVPVIEKDSPTAFITKESIEKGSDIPWLTGVNSEEGLFFYQFLLLDDKRYLELSPLRDNYKKLLPILAYYESVHRPDDYTEKLKQFYFGDKGFQQEMTHNFIELLSDRMINHCSVSAARRHGGQNYMYRLSFRGKQTFGFARPQHLQNGVSHADDLIYLFNIELGLTLELRGKELEMSNTMLDMWYNFIRSGDPTPESHLWEESDGGKKYMDFTNEGPVMASNMFQHRMQFLDKLDDAWTSHDEL